MDPYMCPYMGPYGRVWARMGPTRALEKQEVFLSAKEKPLVPGRVGAPYGPLMGSLWALMGPYGPIWALMGPPGQVLEKASTFRQLSVRQFGPLSHVSGPKLRF